MKKGKMTILKNLPQTLPLLLKKRAEEHPYLNLQAAKNKTGNYEYFTYAQVYTKVIALALSLKKLGIKRGTNVAIISDNRKEWLISDFAIQSLGAADVPRGCDSMGPEIRYIINFAECQTAFLENEKQLQKILDKVSEVPQLKTVIMFESVSQQIQDSAFMNGIKVYFFDSLLEDGIKEFLLSPQSNRQLIESEMQKASPEDTATIIFTSGTTGTPKGVMLSHKNYLSQLSAVHNFMPGKAGQWWMSILPVWHSFERLAQYVAILLHCGIAYSKPVARTLLKDLTTIEPRWMCGVPRLWDALAKGVNQTMEKKGGITLKLYKFFMNIGKKYALARDYVTCNIVSQQKRYKPLDFLRGIFPFLALFPLHLAGDLLVYRKIRAKFGRKFVFAISGGGALQKETDDFFRAINLKMLEGYGMTETAPAIAFRNYKNPESNCVGTPYPTIQVKIVKENHGQLLTESAEDAPSLKSGQKGMIMVKGDHVMKGYYNRPDLTQKIIDKDGWLNTGDLGFMTEDGILKITGRAKDTIVLLGGENIEPAGIEQALCSSDFIESAMIVGQDKKYLSSLIVPNKSAIENFAQEHHILYDTYEKLLQNEIINKLVSDIVNKLISLENGFKTCERISKFKLLSRSFEVGRELSAKLEMMRFKIGEEYKTEIEEMYA